MKEFLVFVLLATAPVQDKQTIAAKWKSAFRSDTTVKLINCRPVRKKADHAVTGYMLVVRTSWIARKASPVDLSNVTKAKFDTWKNSGALLQPNKFQADTANKWEQLLDDNGWETIPMPIR